MGRFFKKDKKAKGGEASVVGASAGPFRRFVGILSCMALLLVLVSAIALIWQRSRSLPSRLEAMEGDIARFLADALDSRKDIISVLESGRKMVHARRDSFRETRVSKEQDAQRLAKMYNLEEVLLPRWLKLLGPQADDEPARTYEERYRLVRSELLKEQERWPAPPDPPLTIVLSVGARKALEGAFVGLAWHYQMVCRGIELRRHSRKGAEISHGDAFRYIVFPFRLAAFSFPWFLGFGLLAAGTGYVLCFLGLKTGLHLLTSFGLAYFLYIVLFVLFFFFVLFGVVR